MADLKHRQRHQIAATGAGDLYITGYAGVDAENCICFTANGTHYQKYGITDGSILYCSRNVEVYDEDLVVVFDAHNSPVLYWFREDRNITSDCGIRVLHDRSKVYAKVLGAFNFYH